MANIRLLPRAEQKLIDCLEKVEKIFPEEAKRCQFSEDLIATVMKDVARSIYLYRDYYPAMQNLLKEATAAKNHAGKGSGTGNVETPSFPELPPAPEACPPGALKRIAAVLAQMKLSEQFRADLFGQDLNLTLSGKNNAAPALPQYTLKSFQGPNHKIVEIGFKKGKYDGVYIESKLFGEEWQFLATDTRKPHLDERPMRNPNVPEVRQYRIRYWHQGVAVGEWSEVQSITLMP